MTEPVRPDEREPIEPELEPLPEDSGALQRYGADTGAGVDELAKAFQLNAEILARIQETQKDIAEHLERSDRSEMVVRSADALNETFRGVRASQTALMSRIEETKSRHGRNLILFGVVGLVLAAGILIGARWLVESTQRETRREVSEAWQADREARDDALARLDALRADHQDAELEVQRLEGEAADLAARLEVSGAESEKLRKSLAALETLPRQLDDLRAQIRVREDRLGERDARLVARDREILELTKQLGEKEEALRVARKNAEDLTAELARREGLAPPGRAVTGRDEEPEIPEGAMTQPAQIDRLVSTLNRLLALAAGEEHYRFETVKGVSGQRLLAVTVRNVGFGAKLRKVIRAQRCRLVLRERQRQVELRFESGTVEYAGAEVGFLNDRYVVFIGGVDPGAWRQAGLTMLLVE